MTFAKANEIWNLIGNKILTDVNDVDITADVLSDAVEKGDARVVLETGIGTWSDQDVIFGSIEQAADYFGADYIMGAYFDNQNQGTTYYQKALDICASITRANEAVTAQEVIVKTGSYKSFPLNPKAGIYRSVPPLGALSPRDATNDSTLEGIP